MEQIQKNIHLDEIDSKLNETDFSIKRKIFSLPKMEGLVFSDPKLNSIYDAKVAENEKTMKYGFHYSENILNQIFNDYVLTSPKYIQKYKQAIPAKKGRRDKSGINALKVAGEKKMVKKQESKPDIDETTGAASSGAYAGPSAWGDGDLKKGKNSPVMRRPIYNGGTMIQESDYLTDPSSFKKYSEMLNEESKRKIEDEEVIDKTNAFTSFNVKNWNKNDMKTELTTLDTGKMDSNKIDKEPVETLKEESMIEPDESSMKFKSTPTGEQSSKMEMGMNSGGGGAVTEGKINQKGYQFYIFDPKQNKIVGGNEFKEDAAEHVKEMGDNLKVYSKQKLVQMKLDPNDKISWGKTPVNESLNNITNLLETLDKELNSYSIHHNKLLKMQEERKPSTLVMKDRLGDENRKNFKKDFEHSGTSKIIDVTKQLEYADQQTDVEQGKLASQIEKNEIKTTGGEALKNVGNSDNQKGDEIPKRNLTTEEQDEVNNYRLGLGDLKFDNKPSERFEERMKADMGDKLYQQRQDKLKIKENMPMYNKESQPTQSGNKKDYNMNENVVGKYMNILKKKVIMDFNLNEAIQIENINSDLYEISLDGMGNKYSSQHDLNENIVRITNKFKYYTDGSKVYSIEKKNVLNESVSKEPVNEQYDKIKHLLNYSSKDFVNNKNNKKY